MKKYLGPSPNSLAHTKEASAKKKKRVIVSRKIITRWIVRVDFIIFYLVNFKKWLFAHMALIRSREGNGHRVSKQT